MPVVRKKSSDTTPLVDPLAKLAAKLKRQLGPFEIEVVDLDQNGETFATLPEAVAFVNREMEVHGCDVAAQAFRVYPTKRPLDSIELTFDWKISDLRIDA